MIDKTFPLAEKILANGLKAAQQLFELLSREYEQLNNQADPSQLAMLAAGKQDAAMQFEQFSKQFGQILATEKLSVSPEGVKSYFDIAQVAHFDIADTWSVWTKIADLAKSCRSLNEQNGACIALLNRHTQRALQILRGKSSLATTYGPDGCTRSELFSHTLISV